MSKHTPGPWFVSGTAEDNVLAVITDGKHGPDALFPIKCEWSESYLIAAAPDLLEALEKVAKALERYDSGHPLIADANAAIAKAKGEV